MTKKQMIDEIALVYKVSELTRKRPEGKLDEILLALAFCDEVALSKICQELHIKVKL